MHRWTRHSRVLVGVIVAIATGAATLLVWLGAAMLARDRTDRQLTAPSGLEPV